MAKLMKLIKTARVISDNLSSIFLLWESHSYMGGFHQVDDIDLIIAINRCLKICRLRKWRKDLSDSDLNLNENENLIPMKI